MTRAWYEEALQAVACASGRGTPDEPRWLAFCGHRAHVLIPCDDAGPLGVIRRWNEPSVAEHELAMLALLQAEEPPAILATLPKPLGVFHRGQSLVSAQTWLLGSPMQVAPGEAGRAATIRHLSAFGAWLRARIEQRPLVPLLPNYVTDMLLRRIGRRTPDGPALRELQHFQQGLGDSARAERGVLHNDLNPGNLLLGAAGEISGVLDWEHAGPGPLLCDWVCFVGEIAIALSVGNRHSLATVQAAIEDAWGGAGWLRSAVCDETRRVLESSGASPEARAACWRLATFHIAYAWVRDESPVAQAAISEWLRRPVPEFIRG